MHGRAVVERPEDFHDIRVQPYLLPRLSERRFQLRFIALLAPAPREGYLPFMIPQGIRAAGKQHIVLIIVKEKRYQHRRGGEGFIDYLKPVPPGEELFEFFRDVCHVSLIVALVEQTLQLIVPRIFQGFI